MQPTKKVLGRILIPDERDKKFPIKPMLSSSPLNSKGKYHGANGWGGNQGSSAQCVAYSWLHGTADGPLTYYGDKSPVVDPTPLYDECQKNDYWTGENYDGTSVRAGAKVLKSKGYITEYKGAWDAETIVRAIIEVAPVVVGTEGTYNMFFPDKYNMISATGQSLGGHAYVLNGANINRGIVRLKNSWGRSGGNNGHAYMTIEDLDKLIKDKGEACLAIPK